MHLSVEINHLSVADPEGATAVPNMLNFKKFPSTRIMGHIYIKGGPAKVRTTYIFDGNI